jgi:5'-nucleotidase
MNILLTNDDGIQSEKLKITEEILSKFGTVTVVAPSKEMSAKSMSLTIGGFTFKKVDDYHYAVDGTPVDCVNFGYAGLDTDFDLVVSGTNNGYNHGIDISYSGTVGATLQGQYFKMKTLALSADRKGNTILLEELEKTIQYVFDRNLLSTDHTININFPRERFGHTNGIRETKIYRQVYTFDPEIVDNKFVPHRGYIRDENLPIDSDLKASLEGYTSISKVYI